MKTKINFFELIRLPGESDEKTIERFNINQVEPYKQEGCTSKVKVKSKDACKKERKRFISVEMFNQLTVNPIIKWDDLSLNCIYKMEKVDECDQKIVAYLTNRDGITVPVTLPEFVIKKLSLLTKEDVTIYLRPHKSKEGENEVDIATMKKAVCKKCSKEFASSRTLWMHQKHHCKE